MFRTKMNKETTDQRRLNASRNMSDLISPLAGLDGSWETF